MPLDKILKNISLEAKIILENIPVAVESLGRQWQHKLQGKSYKTLDEVVSYALNKTQKEKINLVGHSLGGLIALSYTLDNPEKVAQCVTLSTPFQGTYAAYIGTLFLLFGLYPAPAFQMLPKSDFLKRLKQKFKSSFLEIQKNKIQFKNVYSVHDELVSKTSASLENLAGSKQEFIEETILKGYGHGYVSYTEEVYTIVTGIFKQNPFPLVFIHGFALNREFYNKKLERLKVEFPEFTKTGKDRRVFHFSYDYTKPLWIK